MTLVNFSADNDDKTPYSPKLQDARVYLSIGVLINLKEN
jgi:hypothetical protein